MGSAAMDSAGNIALGYSISSSTIYPGIAYTGQLAGDAPTMTPGRDGLPVRHDGSGGQTQYCRWGDYSSMSIDPADDCTFWYTNEYLPENGRLQLEDADRLLHAVRLRSGRRRLVLARAVPSADTIEQGTPTLAVNTAMTTGAAQNLDLSATGVPYNTTSRSLAHVNPSGGSSR